MRQRGYELDVRYTPLGDPLPQTMAGHAGAIAFGGPMSANDNEDWMRREIEWIGTPLREQAPFLGICLGAQMLARHLGGRVMAHEEGYSEIGYWPIRPTAAGRALFDWPGRVYHWHSEGFEWVAGMQRLATGDRFENQAVRYGPSAYGVQFHPEVSYQTMCRWSIMGAHKLHWLGAQDRVSQLREGARHDREAMVWLNCFLDHWLANDPRRKGAGEADQTLWKMPESELLV